MCNFNGFLRARLLKDQPRENMVGGFTLEEQLGVNQIEHTVHSMFNVSRSPPTRYDGLNGLNTSFVADPLASSVYEDPVDPWSAGTPAIAEPVSSEVSGILGAYIYLLCYV